MALPKTGPLKMGDIRTELGMSGVSNFSLINASSATFTTAPPGYPLINKYSRYRPPFIPNNFKVSNWYGYNHTINSYFIFNSSPFFFGPTVMDGAYFIPPSIFPSPTIPNTISFSIIIQLVYPSTTSIVTFSDTCTPAQYAAGGFFFGYIKDLFTVYPGITSFNMFTSTFSVFMGGVEYLGSSTAIP